MQFIQKMVRVGILKRFSILKFILLILNQWRVLLISHFPILFKKESDYKYTKKDQKCFLWCILLYLHPDKNHNERIIDLKEFENDLNFKNIDFPVKLEDITKFENQNPSLPGINVLSVNDNNKFYPLRMTEKDCEETTDLFLYEKDGKSHYSFISSFNRLIRSQIT